MTYEVENKYWLEDEEAVLEKLSELNAEPGNMQRQIDVYLQHPSKDFRQTDEAFRIRLNNGKWCLTYKGPKLDQETKTRREIELDLPEGTEIGPQFQELFEALGFRPALEVRKSRRPFHIYWEEFEVEGVLDEVEELGKFMELEIIANEERLELAKAALKSLAASLGLSDPERRSYADLVAEAKDSG
ncbi:Class IV adenylate cyclase [Planctomycetales bacterium 10988]|nr:Class IV adenylate cyclase [Planctomycetales bacterium 10988]